MKNNNDSEETPAIIAIVPEKADKGSLIIEGRPKMFQAACLFR